MKNTKKKILVFVDWFFPGFKGGGPIQSCCNLVSMLQHDFDIKVITRDTDFGETIPYKDITSDEWTLTPFGTPVLYLSQAKLSYQTIRRILVEEKADHIYLNSMYSKYFTIYPLFACRFNNLTSLVTLAPRGMLYQSAISQKSLKKKPYLRLLKILRLGKSVRFHATNERERDSVHQYFNNAGVFIANNLPAQVQQPLRICEKEKGILRCIFISRIDPIKNLLLLLEVMKELTDTVYLDIIGPVENEIYWQECLNAIKACPPNIAVKVHGPVKNELIETYIRQAHLFVLLSKGENFGHAIFETFLAGRPVLISDQTPWHGLEEKRIGWDLDISFQEGIKHTLEKAAAWDQQEFNIWANAAWMYAKNYLETDKNKEGYYRMFD